MGQGLWIRSERAAGCPTELARCRTLSGRRLTQGVFVRLAFALCDNYWEPFILPAIFPLFRHIQHSASLAGCRRVLDVHGRVAMGAASSTARLDRITALGFSVAEARLALEHTNGDVDRAILCLLAKRRQEAAAEQGLANRVNAILRRQRPWPEFFERFLWPEHLHERLSTNLVYYEAPVLGLGSGLGIGSGLGLGLGLWLWLGLGFGFGCRCRCRFGLGFGFGFGYAPVRVELEPLSSTLRILRRRRTTSS